MSKIFHSITVKFDILLDRVQDLLCCALEGGSNYWIRKMSIKVPEGTTKEDFDKGAKFAVGDFNCYYCNVLFAGGGSLIFTLRDEDQEGKEYTLNIDSIKKGLELMANWKVSRYWQSFVNDNFDSETGDIFLQFCLFGEVIYS